MKLFATALVAAGLSASGALAQSDPCKAAHSGEKSCNADKTTGAGASGASAVPCRAHAGRLPTLKKLPPSVYKCDAPAPDLTDVAPTSAVPPAVPTASATPIRSAFVFRHCLRSTPTTAYGAEGYDSFDNYSSPDHTFPGWPVPAYQCLPQGLQVVQALGAQLNATLPGKRKDRAPSRHQRKA